VDLVEDIENKLHLMYTNGEVLKIDHENDIDQVNQRKNKQSE